MTPTVALTFDDGPSEWTPPLLDVLADHDAHATFFVLGVNTIGREATLKRMVRDGHELAVHGWDHDRTRDVSVAELQNRIVRTLELLAPFAPMGLRQWRPPWNDATEEQIDGVAELGLKLCRSTLEAFDCSRGEREILATLIPGIRAGAIVGLHDGVAENGEQKSVTRWPTVNAVRVVLPRCGSVTVSELLG